MDTTAFRSPKLPPLSLREAKRRRKDIFKATSHNIDVFINVMNLLPDISVTIKTPEGHYIYKNPYSIESANLGNEDAILGKRAQDIYPPATWHIYIEREARVLETGKPYVNQVYGFASDLTNNLCSSSAFPLKDRRGKTIALLTMFKRASSDFQSPAWNDPMQTAITYIRAHLSENLKVGFLARQAGLSSSRFIQLFSARTNETPTHYINKVRINAAKVLLETTNKPMIDIAAETGYFDQSHFCRTFKRITGLTPARYRKQHWAI